MYVLEIEKEAKKYFEIAKEARLKLKEQGKEPPKSPNMKFLEKRFQQLRQGFKSARQESTRN
jgi:hypothetical protein